MVKSKSRDFYSWTNYKMELLKRSLSIFFDFGAQSRAVWTPGVNTATVVCFKRVSGDGAKD